MQALQTVVSMAFLEGTWASISAKEGKGFVSRPDSCAMCYELKLTSPTSFFEPLPHEPLMHIYIYMLGFQGSRVQGSIGA